LISARVQRTAFIFDDRGRMVCERAPDRSAGRRFSVTGSRDGNLAVVRRDVPDLVARRLERLVATEPPLIEADTVPVHLDDYTGLLDVGGAPVEHHHGLLWVFPDRSPHGHGEEVDIVTSGTDAGDRLLARFADVVHPKLQDMGFRAPADLWAPWCAAIENGEAVAIAETVRRGPEGAEVGVDTAVGFRSRGLASTVTAAWSRHPELAGLIRFYSTSRENASSRRVTERLGLRSLGSTFAIT
jgi:hypothetical protein